MRATIKFEVDVNKVKTIMRSLVLEETSNLSDAVNCMEDLAQERSDRLIEGISEALEHIHSASQQLEQYRSMLISFERSRLDSTSPPEPTENSEIMNDLEDVRSAVHKMKQFDAFVSRSQEEETEDVSEAEER